MGEEEKRGFLPPSSSKELGIGKSDLVSFLSRVKRCSGSLYKDQKRHVPCHEKQPALLRFVAEVPQRVANFGYELKCKQMPFMTNRMHFLPTQTQAVQRRFIIKHMISIR